MTTTSALWSASLGELVKVMDRSIPCPFLLSSALPKIKAASETHNRAMTASSTLSYPAGVATLISIPNLGTVAINSQTMLFISPTQAIFLPLRTESGSTRVRMNLARSVWT